jgi:hypothetical protein
MSQKNINVSVTITRTTSNHRDDVIRLRFKDKSSRKTFVEVEMSLRGFAEAVTGLSEIEATAQVDGLEIVGKEKVIESRSVVCPISSYDRGELRAWLEENCQEPGWILDTYLGSQKSVTHHDGKCILNYSVIRYEEAA